MQKHHLLQKAVQRRHLGTEFDDTTVPLPDEYHKKINRMQREGYSSAYLTGMIDADELNEDIEEDE